MNRIEIFDGNWSQETVIKNSKKIYVFGDNDLRIGQGGQAVIRNLENTIGIRTKKKPSTSHDSYYIDKELELNQEKILEDILSIKLKWLEGYTIVFSKNGYGTGLAMLKEMAPLTFDFLCISMRNILGFDNQTGKKWSKLPSITEIETGDYVLFSKENTDLIVPVNNSFFLDSLLKIGITTHFDAIIKEKRISLTSKKSYKLNDIILLSFSGKKEYLVVRVLSSSKVKDLNIWSKFEGVKTDFIFNDIGEYKQTLFSYVCQLSEDGKMIIKDEYFSELLTETVNTEISGTIVEEKSQITGDVLMLEILKQLKEITKKLDNLGNAE